MEDGADKAGEVADKADAVDVGMTGTAQEDISNANGAAATRAAAEDKIPEEIGPPDAASEPIARATTSAWRGAFRVILTPVAGDRDGEAVKELELRPLGPPTTDELQLYSAIGGTAAVLLATFAAPNEVRQHNGYLTRLSRIAKVGLEKGYPSVAAIELNNLRNGLLALEGPRVKNGYMLRLGIWAIGFGLVAALLIAAFRVQDFAKALGAEDWRHSATIFGYLWIGAMVGCWLSFGIRNPQLSFDALSQPDKELLKPPLRLLFTGLLSLTLGLAFVTGAVGVSIGSFNTELLKKAALDGAMTTEAAALALLIGLFCGIGEQALSVSVGQRANQFIGEASK